MEFKDAKQRKHHACRVADEYGGNVPVHGPRVTVVQQPTRCGSTRADPAAIGPEATQQGASVSSDRRAQGERKATRWTAQLRRSTWWVRSNRSQHGPRPGFGCRQPRTVWFGGRARTGARPRDLDRRPDPVAKAPIPPSRLKPRPDGAPSRRSISSGPLGPIRERWWGLSSAPACRSASAAGESSGPQHREGGIGDAASSLPSCCAPAPVTGRS